MKKYNLSEIMKAAWNLRKMSLKWVTSLSFGECLRRAWKSAKEAARVFSGLVRNALTVTGNTYPVRSMMREFGLVWDRDNKAWTGSRETLNSICVKYA